MNQSIPNSSMSNLRINRRAPCSTKEAKHSDMPNMPNQAAVKPGPTDKETEPSVMVSNSFRTRMPMAAPVASSEIPGTPKNKSGFFWDSEMSAKLNTVNPWDSAVYRLPFGTS